MRPEKKQLKQTCLESMAVQIQVSKPKQAPLKYSREFVFNYKKKDMMNELLDGLTDTSTPLNQEGKASLRSHDATVN